MGLDDQTDTDSRVESQNVVIGNAPFIIGGSLSLGIVACIVIISIGDLTSRESGLLSIILTIFSIFGSWAVASAYARKERRRELNESKASLTTFAQKAAEKVTAISNQLARLSIYLDEELADGSHSSPESKLLSREKALASAIYSTQMLKEFAETSLSDWRGVIGDEFEQQQRAAYLEKEGRLKSIATSISELVESQKRGSIADTDALRAEFDFFRDELRAFALGTPRAITTPKARYDALHRGKVRQECPSCSRELIYMQRQKRGNAKGLSCQFCGARLLSTVTDDRTFFLEVRESKQEEVVCPVCKKSFKIRLDVAPGSNVDSTCRRCKSIISIARGRERVKVSAKPARLVSGRGGLDYGISAEILNQVKQELPPQPWPKGAHKDVAERLGLSTGLVAKCIQYLIDKGDCYRQLDGELLPKVEVHQPAPLDRS